MTTADPREGLPSASSMFRHENCAGAWLLEQQVPAHQRLTSADAERGTQIHEAEESSDISELGMSEQELMEKAREAEARIFQQWLSDRRILAEEVEIIRERRWWLLSNGQKKCSAQLDLVALALSRREALVLDLKSGRGQVPSPARNPQLRTGLVILCANYNLLHGRVGIVAPLQVAQPLCDYDATELLAAWSRLDILLEAIHNPTAPRIAGTWCQHCPAQHICPEATAVVEGLAQLETYSWSNMPVMQRVALWDQMKIAKKVIEQLEAIIRQDLAANPESYAGYLEKRPATRERVVTSPIDIYLQMLNRLEMPVEELNTLFNSWCKMGIGEIEKWYWENHGGTQEEAKEWFNNLFGKFVDYRPKSGRVVRVR